MSGHAQRPPAEIRYAGEPARLREHDTGGRSPGWALSLRAARRFVLGDETLGISPPFVSAAWSSQVRVRLIPYRATCFSHFF
jgi:hypothetical protein